MNHRPLGAALKIAACILAAIITAATYNVISALDASSIHRGAEEAAHRIADPELARLKHEVEHLEVVARSLAMDLDAAHARIDDVKLAAEAVVATCPGRARTPQIPKRKRPCPSATDLLASEVPDGR